MIRRPRHSEMREEIILAKLVMEQTAGGGQQQRHARYSAAARFVAWRQINARMAFGGESVDKDLATDRFVMNLPPAREDDRDGWEADTSWVVMWRDSVYRIVRVRRDPITLLAEFDAAFLRRRSDDEEPAILSAEGLLNAGV